MGTATSLWHSVGRWTRIEMGESGKVSELEYKTVTSTLAKTLLLFLRVPLNALKIILKIIFLFVLAEFVA